VELLVRIVVGHVSSAVNPLSVAQIVARNVTPLAGILFFKWSAGNVLLLYLLDTLLSIAVIIAGLAVHFLPPSDEEGIGAWMNAQAGPVAMALVLVVFFAVPLGMPIFIMLGASNFSYREALADPSLRGGALCQAIAALWSYAGLYRAVRVRTPEELKLKRRFALVFLRWIAVIMVTYTGIPFYLGHYGALFLVVAFIAVSIFAEVAPDRFLRAMPGGAEDAEDGADAGSPTAKPTTPPTSASIAGTPARSRKRRRRR
jgi:hypothetical protein